MAGDWTHIGDSDFDEYLEAELRRALEILGSSGARIVVTTEPFNHHGERSDGTLYPEDQPSRVRRWNTMLRNVVADLPNVDVLDLNAKLRPTAPTPPRSTACWCAATAYTPPRTR